MTSFFNYYFFLEPKIESSTILPTFLSNPCFVVIGIPVFVLIFCLGAVIPITFLKEKLNPRIFITISILHNK